MSIHVPGGAADDPGWHNGCVPRCICPRRAGRVVLGALIATVAAGPLAAGPLSAGARAATVAVSRSTTGAPIPSGFLGISTETHDLETFTGSDPKAIDPAFLRLIGQIAPGQRPVMRIGGDSTDASWYPISGHAKPKGVTFTITRRWLQIARATAEALDGKLIVGVNLEANEVSVARAEADAMVRTIGAPYIEAMEIGNEPNLYHHFPWYHTASGVPVKGRPASYSEADYFAQFAAYARALPRIPIAGPVLGVAGTQKPDSGNWLEDLGGFLRADPFTSLVTIHAYPLEHCTPSHIITIPELLADSVSDGFVSEVTPFVRTAQAFDKPIRIDEVNAISCGGTAGVSNSFASALWMMNTLFGLAHTGVGGVNVHMTPGAINAILNPVGSGSHRAIAVQPEYYTMMMFAQAAPPGARILQLHESGLSADEQAWATRDAAGTVRIVLIDKSARQPATTTLTVPGVAGPGTVESLRARSLQATEGVTLGGQTFGDATQTGELAGTPQAQTVTPVAGRYRVTVPAASIEMLTLPAPAGDRLLSALDGSDLFSGLLTSW